MCLEPLPYPIVGQNHLSQSLFYNAHSHKGVSIGILPPREEMKILNLSKSLLNAHHICTIVKLKNCKLNCCKSETVCIFLVFCDIKNIFYKIYSSICFHKIQIKMLTTRNIILKIILERIRTVFMFNLKTIKSLGRKN